MALIRLSKGLVQVLLAVWSFNMWNLNAKGKRRRERSSLVKTGKGGLG